MSYEQRITAEFEQEIAELNGKLYERDMEIERLRADNEARMAYLFDALKNAREPSGVWVRHRWGGDWREFMQGIDVARGRAASRDEERDNG